MPQRQRASVRQQTRQAPRLLGGARRGLLLQTSQYTESRPTAVRARKALFDTLAHRTSLRTDFTARENFHTDGSLWLLDAFAGSGALGLEALSRWQGRGVFFENDAATAKVLCANVEQSGLDGRVLRCDALAPMPARSPDEQGNIQLAFFDPPYAMPEEEAVRAPASFAEQGWLGEGALVVFQRAAGGELLSLGGKFASLGTLLSSSACFFFFRYKN